MTHREQLKYCFVKSLEVFKTDFKIEVPEVQSKYRKLFDKVGEAEGLNSLRGF